MVITAHDGKEEEFEMTLNALLALATGCPLEPPLGFQPAPTLSFQSDSPYPVANTCANTIHVPMLQESASSFGKFAYYVTSGVLNTAGFGQFS